MGWFTEAEAQALERKYGPARKAETAPERWQHPQEKWSDKELVPTPSTKPHGPCQSLWIPNWTPGLLNQWDGHHWSKRSKIKKADAHIVRAYAATYIRPAYGRRRVSLLFILPKGKRMFDSDAPLKSCLDALVQCKALVNDSPKWCLLGPVSYARAIGVESVVGTLILLEDI